MDQQRLPHRWLGGSFWPRAPSRGRSIFAYRTVTLHNVGDRARGVTSAVVKFYILETAGTAVGFFSRKDNFETASTRGTTLGGETSAREHKSSSAGATHNNVFTFGHDKKPVRSNTVETTRPSVALRQGANIKDAKLFKNNF